MRYEPAGVPFSSSEGGGVGGKNIVVAFKKKKRGGNALRDHTGEQKDSG